MARPRISNAKYRREYVIRCVDPHFHSQRFFVRDGYKSLLLREFVKLYPYHHISIYVLSDEVFQNI